MGSLSPGASGDGENPGFSPCWHLPKHLASCPKPLCTSCQLGTAHRSATPSIGTLLDVGHLKPSDCVSVDQLESNAPGSVHTSWGLPTKCTYQAAILCCDYASCYLFLTCHHSTGAGEAVAAKRAFEREASLANVTNMCWTTSISADMST